MKRKTFLKTLVVMPAAIKGAAISAGGLASASNGISAAASILLQCDNVATREDLELYVACRLRDNIRILRGEQCVKLCTGVVLKNNSITGLYDNQRVTDIRQSSTETTKKRGNTI